MTGRSRRVLVGIMVGMLAGAGVAAIVRDLVWPRCPVVGAGWVEVIEYPLDAEADKMTVQPPRVVPEADRTIQRGGTQIAMEPIRGATPPRCEPSGVDPETFYRWRRACLREQANEQTRELERAYRAHLAREGLAPATTHLPIGGF